MSAQGSQLDPKEIEAILAVASHGCKATTSRAFLALHAGLPVSTAAITVNRFALPVCRPSRRQLIRSCEGAAVIGGGTKLSAHRPRQRPSPALKQKYPGIYMVMGETAEVVAKRYKISRQAQDEYSLISQQRTARAQQEGFFAAEIAPMKVTKAVLDKKTGAVIGTEEVCCDRDECNRPDTTLEALLALKPHFDPNSGQGSVTAGNSSQLSDGASATLLMSRQRATNWGSPTFDFPRLPGRRLRTG
jgi:acetyl-CoA acetyltransferase